MRALLWLTANSIKLLAWLILYLMLIQNFSNIRVMKNINIIQSQKQLEQ